MTKPDIELRKHPLVKVFPLVDELENVVLFHPKPIWEEAKVPVCFCRKNNSHASDEVVQCEECWQWYHTSCIDAAFDEDEDYVCGYCQSPANDKGERDWDPPNPKFKKSASTRKDKDTPKAKGWERDSETIIVGKKRSWGQELEESQKRGQEIRAEIKRQKAKAKKRLQSGDHHLTDEIGNGGVQPRSLTPELVDELLQAGELDDIDLEDGEDHLDSVIDE
jgi:hypothetical protein